jgi:hypothetical protein
MNANSREFIGFDRMVTICVGAPQERQVYLMDCLAWTSCVVNAWQTTSAKCGFR